MGLGLFARQSNTPVLYLNETLGWRRINAVIGKYTVRHALEILLRNTGISGVINEAGVLTVTVGAFENNADKTESTMQENDNHVGRGASWLGAVAAFFAVGSAAHAQDTAQVLQSESGKLEEIVVTAQKRTENLQSVPISAQVVSGQTLTNQNINNLQDLTQTLPGVHISSEAFSNTLTIRGIGSGAGNPSFDQSVATFVDDIYHGRSRMTDETFLDIDRIEVLKGPQSIFFGYNAIAGALNVVTKKPGDTFEASGRVLYGQFGQYSADGAISVPVTNALSVRLAVTRNGQVGWIENVNIGEKAPRENNEAGRVTVVFRPTENLDATLKVEGSDSKTAGSVGLPSQWVNCPPPAPLTPGYGGFGACQIALTLPNIPMGLKNNNNTGLAGQGTELSTFEDALTINYHEWSHTFTSVSGFYNYHYDAQSDSYQLPLYLLTDLQPEKYHQFSQELRVASAAGGRLEYLAGIYFQTDELDSNTEVNAPFLSPLIEAYFPPLVPYLPLSVAGRGDFTQNEHVYSAFASAKWNATDRLQFNAGLRASWVDKDFTGTNNYGTATQTYGGFVALPPALNTLAGNLGLGAAGSQSLSTSERAFMPSGGVEYQLTGQAMTYLSYNRGFKAGGFNGQDPLEVPENVAYGPEHVNAYELGIKSKWLDDTVLLNLDVFRSDYTDLQVNSEIYDSTLNTYTIYVKNAAQARSQGAELEAQWAATRDLRFSANITYLNSYYVSYPNGSPYTLQNFCTGVVYATSPECHIFPNPVPTIADHSGEATQFSPRWSGSVSAAYTLELPGDFKFTTQLDPYFTSSYNEQDPYVLGTSAYVRLDARLVLAASGGHWAIDVIGKNLTDRIIVDSGSLYGATKEMPRNVAVQFRYRY